MKKTITNIIVAGLGGQGVLKSTDILAEALFREGNDVKKSELHGMSQRGGSLKSDVRFGENVFSPMIGEGEADYLLVLTPDQVEVNQHWLSAHGQLLTPEGINPSDLPHPKSVNVCMLGILDAWLALSEESWKQALQANLPAPILEKNWNSFLMGKSMGEECYGKV